MEQLSQAALQKLARDLKDLQANAIDGVKVWGQGSTQPVAADRLNPAGRCPTCPPSLAMFSIAAAVAAANALLFAPSPLPAGAVE